MLGKKIRETREQKGLSQKQLAGEEMTRAYISLIEKGRAVPSSRMLRVIAKRLGKPVEYFLGSVTEDEIHEDVSEALLDKAYMRFKAEDDDSCIRIAEHLLTLAVPEPVQAEAYLLMIRSCNRMKQYSRAAEHGESSEFLFIRSGDRKLITQFYLEMGKAAIYMESYIQAKKQYQQAYTYSSKLKHLQEEHITALTFLATSHMFLGEIPEAIDAYLKAEDEARMAGNPESYGEIAMGLGKAYFKSDPHSQESLYWTQKSVDCLKQGNSESYIFALHNLAVIMLHTDKKKEALPLLHECASIYDERNMPDKKASIFEEMSKLYLEEGNLEEAEKACKTAIRLLDLTDSGVQRARLYRLMGAVYHEQANPEQAYFFLRMSYDLLKRLNAGSEAESSYKLLTLSERNDGMDYNDYRMYLK
ncbi:helix-turn-helix transcriptional regulator [Paenibacillus urinalis]|uniref:Helix-turn-helix transcriptional regulator n=1 Tax=Paenibacillus urinalis TaxID=521520 RepID=A0ABY7XB53_9BACL|nr:helix-turn-helix transcriptional regulator [Paenibacillus urinalis]WDH99113.1 helix-turn-helix transcriptional regulator [Paenibacillus urinalis]WDI02803.1 helix-turn-helix transcriptional regulator [Paenibacillus urinalis]